MAKQPWTSQTPAVHLNTVDEMKNKALQIKTGQVDIRVKTKKYLTACSRSCAAAAICPLSLLSII